jgi:two-component system, OmpR family, sensor histidine kinase ChvG
MATTRPPRAPSLLLHSFSLKLFLLSLILLTVPLVLYWQFARFERDQSELLRNAAAKTGRVIAAMLRPHFEHFGSERQSRLQEALSDAAAGNTNVQVLERPRGAAADFYFIASTPPVPAGDLRQELGNLKRSGIFESLASTCDVTPDLAVHFVNAAGMEQILTSMTPVHRDGNCWVVVTYQNAADFAPATLRLSSWKISVLEGAAVIYVLSVVLVVWLLVHIWRNLYRFRKAARRIRLRGAGDISFRGLNTIPELTHVAEDFDSLVEALTTSQAFIKRTAEENAHALKAPLGVIAQSLEPLKRAVPASEIAAQRSLHLIERSVAKLDALVSVARDLEQAAADVVYPIRQEVRLTEFVAELLRNYQVTLFAQGKRLLTSLSGGVTASANEDILEPVIENLLENAASFTPKGGIVEVTLEHEGEHAVIRVADRGPGVPPDRLSKIFDRYVTYRDDFEPEPSHAGECHQGLGLWIVKRNVEGLGGSVTARNRHGGGLEVIVNLKVRP